MLDLRCLRPVHATGCLAVSLGCLLAMGCRQESTPSPLAVQVTGPASRENVIRSIREQFLPFGCETLRTDPAVKDPEFHALVRGLGKAADEVPVTTIEQPSTWTSVKLNADHLGFDAIRFTSPLDEVGDLRLAMAAPLGSPVTWHIMSMRGEVTEGFTCRQAELDLDLPSLQMPGRNRVVFQPLDKGQIKPREQYILWFVIAYDESIETKISLKVVPQGTYPHSHDSEHLAAHLGVRTPLQRFDVRTADRLAFHATKALRRTEDAHAIQLSQRAIAAYRGQRQALLVSIVANLRQGIERTESEGDDAGFEFFRRAGDSARNVAEFVANPTDREQSEVSRALFYEAVALARAGDLQGAAQPLSAAIEGGFHVDTAKPWAADALAEHPELDRLVKKSRSAHEASE